PSLDNSPRQDDSGRERGHRGSAALINAEVGLGEGSWTQATSPRVYVGRLWWALASSCPPRSTWARSPPHWPTGLQRSTVSTSIAVRRRAGRRFGFSEADLTAPRR